MKLLQTLSLLALSLGGSIALPSPSTLQPRQSRTTITVNPNALHQIIDGLGFSGAFQRANLIVNLPAPQQRQVLDLLFNTTTGAGFSILRNGIGSTPNSDEDYMNTILPRSPGSPDARPEYVWDGKDSGQLWLSQRAKEYGVRQFYANAWSAPGFMKNNNDDMNGGKLCGLGGTRCASGDWRQAYANYLVQYIKFYAQEGVDITHLGFVNEPDLTTTYASMLATGAEAAEFIKILHPTLQSHNLSHVSINCCEATGWSVGAQMLQQIQAAGAEPLLGVYTAHTYTSTFSGPLNTNRKVWQSEYSDLSGRWTTAWYSSGGSGEGYTWANTLHAAFATANLNGYLWWEGVQWPSPNNNEKLILLDGERVTVSKRLWAFAQYSRYVRPGARRIGAAAAGGGGGGVKVTAYRNVDGSVVVVGLNTGTGAVELEVEVEGEGVKAARAYVTDEEKDMEETAVEVAGDGRVTARVGGRGLITFVLTA